MQGRQEGAARKRFLVVLAFLGVLCAFGLAQNAAIRLSSYPAISVADGRSTLTIDAEVRNNDGNLAPDGTQVLFETNNGTFRENIVRTVNGVARGTYIAGSVAGIVVVRASVLGFNARGVIEIELVADKAQLSNAKDYIEIYSPRQLDYSPEKKVIAAEASDKGVHLRYRNVEIDANEIQFDVPTYEVRAKKAKLKLGQQIYPFEELYLKLNQRKGFGVAVYSADNVQVRQVGWMVGTWREVRDRLGLMEIRPSGISPTRELVPPSTFAFKDLSEVASLVSAQRAVAYPGKQIQFQKAAISVGTRRVMSLPLYQISVHASSPVLSDQFLNVTGNQVAINYPHYLSLRPGQSSLLRFRTGTPYSSGVGSTGGLFLDYEMAWNRGSEMDGRLVVSSLGRKDWGVSIRQFLKLNDRTSASAQLDFPGNRSLLGSINASHQLPGMQLNASANITRSTRGPKYDSEQTYLALEKDPIKLGNFPMRLFLGATGSQSHYVTDRESRSQSAYGVRARFQLLPRQLTSSTTLNSSLMVNHLIGGNFSKALTTHAMFTLGHRINRNASASLTYEWLDDGFNDALVGHHRVSMQAYWGSERFGMSTSLSKSLDLDRMGLFSTLNFRLSNTWRILGSYSIDRYKGRSYRDYSVVLAYRLGIREIGISWSGRTRRFGFELFGASF